MAEDKKDVQGASEPVMTERTARGKILVIEGGKDGIVALDREVRELDRRADELRRKRASQKVAIENMKASGFLGTARVFLGGAQAGLEDTEEKLGVLTDQIREKSATVYRGIVSIDNIVDQFVLTDRQYRAAEIIQLSLQKANMMTGLYLKAVLNAQIKIEGALTDGAGAEAAQMVGTDIELATEKYNTEASQALKIVKLNSASFHAALREYASHLKESPGWHVSVAIDAESALNVDVLTMPEYMDVYTPKKLEEVKAQLLVLHEAIKTISGQIAASYKELQDLKKDYLLAKKKKLCDHLFDDHDREYHQELARSSLMEKSDE